MQLISVLGSEMNILFWGSSAPPSEIFAYVAGGFLLCSLILVGLAVTAKPMPGHE